VFLGIFRYMYQFSGVLRIFQDFEIKISKKSLRIFRN
jgi:hypothetical protein